MSARNIFMLSGVFVAIWAVLGLMDVGNDTFIGYGTDFDNNVATVQDGGPAEAAGMQVGDRIQSIDGITVEDVRAQSSQPRATVGQVRTIIVDRDGDTVELSLTVAAQSSSGRIDSYIGILIGLAFVGMGLWAFFTAATPATQLLARAGVLFGVVFAGGPYLGTSTLASIAGALIFFCIVMAFAVLLHFMIVFPDGAEPNKRLVYGPAALMGLLLLGLTIFQPDATSGLNRVLQLVFFVWIVGYLGLTLFKMARTWARASADDRSRHGLNILVLGTGLGLGLLLLGVAIGVLLPTVTIPGSQWFGLTLILVPVSCALAAVKSARA